MKKRGQVSIYIIISIVLLIIGIIVISLVSNLPENDQVNDADEIKAFVDSCLSITLNEGLNIVGLQGGYYKLQPPYVETWTNIPYYVRPITSKFVENELKLYVEDNILGCLNFSKFNKDVVIEDNASAEVSIDNNGVIATMNLPVKVVESFNEKTFNVYTARKESKLSTMIDMAALINIKAEKDEVPLSTLLDIESKKGIDIDVINEPGLYQIYILQDKGVQPNYIFMFAK